MKENSIPLDEESISITTLIPLWARAQECKKIHPILIDHLAQQFVKVIDFDFSIIEKTLGEYGQLLYPIRAKAFDIIVSDFVARSKNPVIVNLGAGLDTTFSRVAAENVLWFDLDLPEIIKVVKKLVPETKKHRFISMSVLNFSWIKIVKNIATKIFNKKTQDILFLAGGLFLYIPEEQLKKLFKTIGEEFPGAEMIFDTISLAAKKATNRQLANITRNHQKVEWGAETPEQVLSWDKHLKLVDYFTTFEKTEKKEHWEPLTHHYMNLNETTHSSGIYHIRYEN